MARLHKFPPLRMAHIHRVDSCFSFKDACGLDSQVDRPTSMSVGNFLLRNFVILTLSLTAAAKAVEERSLFLLRRLVNVTLGLSLEGEAKNVPGGQTFRKKIFISKRKFSISMKIKCRSTGKVFPAYNN